MPLVVRGRGRVLFLKPKRPVKIGERVYDNALLAEQKRTIALNQLSRDMYRVQTSILKGK